MMGAREVLASWAGWLMVSASKATSCRVRASSKMRSVSLCTSAARVGGQRASQGRGDSKGGLWGWLLEMGCGERDRARLSHTSSTPAPRMGGGSGLPVPGEEGAETPCTHALGRSLQRLHSDPAVEQVGGTGTLGAASPAVPQSALPEEHTLHTQDICIRSRGGRKRCRGEEPQKGKEKKKKKRKKEKKERR